MGLKANLAENKRIYFDSNDDVSLLLLSLLSSRPVIFRHQILVTSFSMISVDQKVLWHVTYPTLKRKRDSHYYYLTENKAVSVELLGTKTEQCNAVAKRYN